MKPLFKGQKMFYRQSKYQIKRGEEPKPKSRIHLEDELRMKQKFNRRINVLGKRRKKNKVARVSRQANR